MKGYLPYIIVGILLLAVVVVFAKKHNQAKNAALSTGASAEVPQETFGETAKQPFPSLAEMYGVEPSGTVYDNSNGFCGCEQDPLIQTAIKDLKALPRLISGMAMRAVAYNAIKE